jgi:hypothetical protein
VPFSPYADDEKPLRDEAQYLIAQLRDPGTSEDGAIRLTLENYPYLREDECRTWFRMKDFRREVREAREVARGYAAEDAAGPRSPYTTETDPWRVWR